MEIMTGGEVVPDQINVSIVSHSHGDMVSSLVAQLLSFPQVGRIIVTCNVHEELNLPVDARVVRINNLQPKGFGANHNAAFLNCASHWFVVLNPDVVLCDNPFPALMDVASRSGAALLSPRAVGSGGAQEDCWRRFPTLWSLLCKLLGEGDGRSTVSGAADPGFEVDWVSGLCMFVKSEAYSALGGFDERYFLYYEDVDFCVRAWRANLLIWACPAACLVHNAQRASRSNFRHMRWHLASMLRYLITQSWRLPRGLKA
jgi:N-acetylglucosaminyl-diphospho-decaprenol L-rhamnosyltransferase